MLAGIKSYFFFEGYGGVINQVGVLNSLGVSIQLITLLPQGAGA